MRNLLLKYKGDFFKGNNLHFSTAERMVDGKYVVEVWDVTKSYFNFKPLDVDLAKAEGWFKKVKGARELTDEEKEDEAYLRKMRSYGNKRVLVDKETFEKDFEVVEVVYLNTYVEHAGCEYWPHYKDSRMAWETANEMRGCSPMRIRCVK